MNEEIVTVEIVEGSDGGDGSVGGGGVCDLLMEGLGKAVNIELNDTNDGKDDGG